MPLVVHLYHPLPQALDYMAKYNVTYDAKYPYASGSTGITGACQTTLLQSTRPGQVFQPTGATYVYPFNNQAAIQAVSSGRRDSTVGGRSDVHLLGLRCQRMTCSFPGFPLPKQDTSASKIGCLFPGFLLPTGTTTSNGGTCNSPSLHVNGPVLIPR